MRFLHGLPLGVILAIVPTAVFAQADSAARAPAFTLPTPRLVTFTTTEGTWMSLDVSPDGRRIIFDPVGDIYAMPIGRGTSTRITSGPAMDAQPRFSPVHPRLTEQVKKILAAGGKVGLGGHG